MFLNLITSSWPAPRDAQQAVQAIPNGTLPEPVFFIGIHTFHVTPSGRGEPS